MREGHCFVVGAGDFTSRGLMLRPGDLLIAADGGLEALRTAGLQPHCVIGDMDSYAGSLAGVPSLRFPRLKDDSDLALGVRLGLKQGFRRFRLYGASGGARDDHFVAALQLMAGHARQGLEMRLTAPGYEVYALHNQCRILPASPGCTVSVFSHAPASRGVVLKGLQYEAGQLVLSSDQPLGLSNTARHSRILVGVRDGLLLVFVSQQAS